MIAAGLDTGEAFGLDACCRVGCSLPGQMIAAGLDTGEAAG